MSSREHHRIVVSWLSDLANVTAGNAPLPDAKTKIGALASLIADDFPGSAAFTRQSLAAVARECSFFPSYAELTKHLGTWWKANRPSPVAIKHDQSDLNKINQQHADAEASWQGIDAFQISAKVRELAGNPLRLALGRILAVAVERHAPRHLGLLPPEFLIPPPTRS